MKYPSLVSFIVSQTLQQPKKPFRTSLEAKVSLHRTGEVKPIERYKSKVKVAEENKLFSSFQKNIIEFLGLDEQAQKFGLGFLSPD